MVTGSPPPPSARAIAAAFGLAGTVGELVAVAGAWSNRVFRLEVGDAAFAVKELLDTWREPSWFDRLDDAWRFELAAIEAGTDAPEPIPNPADGGWRADVERVGGRETATVRVHRWVDAEPAPPGVASAALATWSGATLARLHALGVVPHRPELFTGWSPEAFDRWASLVAAADDAGVSWLDLAHRATPAVEVIRQLFDEVATGRGVEPMSHRDVDQKNILVGAAGPLLCDWDVAGPVDPREELVDVALSMARWEQPAIARTVLDAYRDAGGEVFRPEPVDVAPMLFSSVNWLVLNVERALGLRGIGPGEQELGAALAPELLARLPERVAMTEHIDVWLTS
jgi:hypothetical protein